MLISNKIHYFRNFTPTNLNNIMRKSNYLWLLLVAVLLLPVQEMAAKKKKEKEVTDRELWVGVLYQMAAPD